MKPLNNFSGSKSFSIIFDQKCHIDGSVVVYQDIFRMNERVFEILQASSCFFSRDPTRILHANESLYDKISSLKYGIQEDSTFYFDTNFCYPLDNDVVI